MKIVLLEDDEVLGETIKDMLEDEGYEILWCQRADEVIDATFSERFDLYIFDIGVPDMEGTELLRALREGEDKTPAFFISARVDLDSVREGFSSGGFDYIKKPFFPEELLLRIRARFDKKSSEQKSLLCGDCIYHSDSRILECPQKRVVLSELLGSLLYKLISSGNSVVDKSELMDSLSSHSDVALRVAMNKLKKETGLPIKSVRGVGYILEKC
jgi:DNA-binding response OmpR family regulator